MRPRQGRPPSPRAPPPLQLPATTTAQTVQRRGSSPSWRERTFFVAVGHYIAQQPRPVKHDNTLNASASICNMALPDIGHAQASAPYCVSWDRTSTLLPCHWVPAVVIANCAQSRSGCVSLMLPIATHACVLDGLQVERVNKFTSQLVGALRTSLKSLSGRVEKENNKENQEQLLAEAKRIGDEFLALEKYVNLNYMVGPCRYKGFPYQASLQLQDLYNPPTLLAIQISIGGMCFAPVLLCSVLR
eukprot:747015-Pelagomonas_calceolata.AAC.4